MNVNEISELTRREILDFILDDEEKPINGRLELIQFLERTWDLKSMLPSNYDYDCLKSAIWQHMINNNDWSYHDLLKNQLHLLTCADDVFLKFLGNCLHPYVVRNQSDVEPALTEINQLLEPDGYVLNP